MKHLQTFESFIGGSTEVYYRLIGGSQFGGPPITHANEPKPGQVISGVFATPHPDAVDAMIEYCLDQGEDEMTGNPITEDDLRVLEIGGAKARAPRGAEKFMDWEDSDKDEVIIDSGKITKVYTVKEWEIAKK